MPPQIPILLLKTKSSPEDGYADFFSAHGYTPTFVPVLEHRVHESNLGNVRALLAAHAFSDVTRNTPIRGFGRRKFGGLIFTSQRAVEAFAGILEAEGEGEDKETKEINNLEEISIPLYTVGPATARSLGNLATSYLPNTSIHGAETGNGENLAYYILDHYNSLYPDMFNRPPLLFLVGEQRRDIIPKLLMESEDTPPEKRILVEEIVVYETGVREGFESDFGGVVSSVGTSDGDGKGSEKKNPIFVVVFSPTGCEAMLRVLGIGPFASTSASPETEVFIATIGPTTRDHLRQKFGFEPHVCAAKPSPEGVGAAIEEFMARRS
ncbi:hypothetical protein N7510_009236 [Penicillium lagena]|uniref:uncharacterized protein n=1 Tax=Penicillium lagena TaxID=94218 RepID=UPI002541B720|nr:uncharacterized protein N7510_009236 [Penicillium lagena]KAJ5606455.1 hypothetical protein N7510_009236 [Penicillium lagena]